jgi:hypothetical protein
MNEHTVNAVVGARPKASILHELEGELDMPQDRSSNG